MRICDSIDLPGLNHMVALQHTSSCCRNSKLFGLSYKVIIVDVYSYEGIWCSYARNEFVYVKIGVLKL